MGPFQSGDGAACAAHYPRLREHFAALGRIINQYPTIRVGGRTAGDRGRVAGVKATCAEALACCCCVVLHHVRSIRASCPRAPLLDMRRASRSAPAAQASSKFVLVPGPDDLGPGSSLPRAGLPHAVAEPLLAAVPNAVLASNPCRWGGGAAAGWGVAREPACAHHRLPSCAMHPCRLAGPPTFPLSRLARHPPLPGCGTAAARSSSSATTCSRRCGGWRSCRRRRATRRRCLSMWRPLCCSRATCARCRSSSRWVGGW